MANLSGKISSGEMTCWDFYIKKNNFYFCFNSIIFQSKNQMRQIWQSHNLEGGFEPAAIPRRGRHFAN